MAPIRSLPLLPIELWNIILLLTCHTVSRNLRVQIGTRFKAYIAPIAVSQVCRSWRDLVINCPQFWTDICYSFTYVAYSPRPRPELMQLILERSLVIPLTLDIQILEIGDADNRSAAYAFFLALLADRNRWRSVKLFISSEAIDGDTWEELLDGRINDAPLLETLEVTIDPGQWGLGDTLSGFLWNAAPKLTKLAIEFEGTEPAEEREMFEDNDEFLSNWALTVGIPYDQLTHLLLDPGPNGEVTWKEIASIFALSSNLVSCSLSEINGYLGLPGASTPRVILQHLQHLDLSGPQNREGYNNRTLLSSMNQILTAPSLQTLSLLQSEDRWDQNAYGDFIARSNPPLTALHFGLSPRKSPHSLLECIRLSPPTLRSLHTNHTGVILPEFSEQLAEWDESAGQFKLCPILEKLMFDMWIPPEFPTPFNGMVDMLRKRLCPPDGSSGSFKKLIVSSDIRRNAEEDLISLLDAPYRLQIECAKVCSQARSVFELGSNIY